MDFQSNRSRVEKYLEETLKLNFELRSHSGDGRRATYFNLGNEVYLELYFTEGKDDNVSFELVVITKRHFKFTSNQAGSFFLETHFMRMYNQFTYLSNNLLILDGLN